MLWRLIGLAVFLAAAALIWQGYENIGELSGGLLWPYRYLVLALAAFLLLTVINRLMNRFVGDKEKGHS